ncbi:MAG: chloride channel protein [Patescibacteria group bacterium]|nr:chloride channel protein [Patescibacteria group bacterium]
MQKLKTIVTVFIVSILVPIIYLLFTNLVHYLQELIWFDIADVNNNKIVVIPLSIIGGLILSWAIMVNKNKLGRELSHDIKELTKDIKISPKLVVSAFLIGIASLVGGASLGPEAILIPICYGAGFLVAKNFKIEKPEFIGLIAIISLLASFFNGIVAAVLPLAFISYMMSKNKKNTIILLLLGSLAALISVVFLRLIGVKDGYVKIPLESITSINYKMLIVALVVGFIATYMTGLLYKTSKYFKTFFEMLPKKWITQGFVAGLGVGVAYYLLGPMAFFSGHYGLEELIKQNSQYTSFQLAGLAVGKLLVTAWCIATIYRGGLIYPLLLSGMSIALLLTGAYPDNNWLIALLVATFVGAFGGNFKSAIVGAAFVLPLFGIGSLSLVMVAMIGSGIALRLGREVNNRRLATQ